MPILAVHLAWWMNLPYLATNDCNPYVTGCMSVSGASRGGPGLHLFRALVLPSASLLALSWIATAQWLSRVEPTLVRSARVVGLLGFIGAVFLVLYATWLGTDGHWYRWLRRQGVVFFFGLTGLAQLVLAAKLWGRRQWTAGGQLRTAITVLVAIVSCQWLIGLISAFKDVLVSEAIADPLGNVLEWSFLWTLGAAQAVIAVMLTRSHFGWRVELGRP